MRLKRLLMGPAFCVLVLSTAVAAAQNQAGSHPGQVLIIRHAEKTGAADDIHLSKRGLERAHVLYQLFQSSAIRKQALAMPDFIIAADHSKDSQRPLETVTPLAKKLNLAVDHSYKSKNKKTGKNEKDMFRLRDDLFNQPKYRGKTILVAWRHTSIPELAKVLGVKDAPAKWADDVFDRVWQITFDERGVAEFRDLPQLLLPGDSGAEVPTVKSGSP